MAKLLQAHLDTDKFGQPFRAQFSGLEVRDPSAWPAVPRRLLYLSVAAGVMAVLWLAWLNFADETLASEQGKEDQLRLEFKVKLAQAAQLGALKQQRVQLQKDVAQLEGQLPGKAEMNSLLSEINQAGLRRNLQFELFKPGQISVKDYYAELPIGIRVTGRYHDIGAFAGDIAALPRIVTLNNLSLQLGKDGQLTLDTTAQTFRHLDGEELARQHKPDAAIGVKK